MMNNGNYQRTVAPAIEPVTLAEAKAHLTGYNSADDSYITGLITKAREAFESVTELALIEQTWVLTLPCFWPDIEIMRPPLRSVESVTYYDTVGAQQTLASTEYRTAKRLTRAVMTEAYGKSFPSVESGRPDAVAVTFKSGIYAADASSPPGVDLGSGSDMMERFTLAQQAIVIMVDHLYRNRGVVAPIQLSEVPMAYSMLVGRCMVGRL